MSDAYLTVNSDNFQDILGSDKLVVIDFWATWCGPCKMLAPEIEALAEENRDTVVVAKCDVDECADIAERYGIMSVPSVLVFKGGELVETMVGYRKKAQLLAVISKYFAE